MDLLAEILRDTQALAERVAHPSRRVLQTSPEVAAWLRAGDDTTSEADGNAAPVDVVAALGADGAASEHDALAELARQVASCRRCGLCETRTQTVFGVGSPRARLLFVGEAPGEQEDLRGEPFVGAAGQFLTRVIEGGFGLRREDVYICNVLKCRPPGNRDPRADEVAECEPYLIRQIELISPSVICALGGHAAKTLLRTAESTTRLRGKWHSYHGIPLRVTYHPSYLIRSKDDPERFAENRRKVWEDVKAILRVLDTGDDPTLGPGSLEA